MESKIYKKVEEELRKLLPSEGMEIRFQGQTDARRENKGFYADISYRNIQFRLVGDIEHQGSMPILRNKINQVKKMAALHKKEIPVIAAPYLSPDKQSICREAGINFFDLSGNVFLSYECIHIERIGFSNKYPEKRKGRGAFSDKASLILRVLLAQGQKEWGVRELAQMTGLDPGFVSRMARELEQREYIVRAESKIRLRDPKSILEDWVREYNYRKNRLENFFYLATDADVIINTFRQAQKELPDFTLSMHAGAGLVSSYAAYNEVHIYIEEVEDIASFQKVMNLTESRKGANVIFMLPHYKHSILWDVREIKGMKIVSDLQLYLDLYHYPLRGREQAEHLYQKRLRHLFEG